MAQRILPCILLDAKAYSAYPASPAMPDAGSRLAWTQITFYYLLRIYKTCWQTKRQHTRALRNYRGRRARLSRQYRAAFRAAGADNGSSAAGFHTGTETVRARAADFGGLKGSFHGSIFLNRGLIQRLDQHVTRYYIAFHGALSIKLRNCRHNYTAYFLHAL